MNRREFIEMSGCFGLACASGCLSRVMPRGEAYSVALLGDTHFDAEPESVYHSHYDESNRYAKIQHEEFRRNGEMWRERCRRLVASAGALAHEKSTKFVLQLGDLVQGDCDDAATHVKMLEDAIAVIRGPFPAGIPFATVIGNHDYRGKGARDAYLSFMEPFLSVQLGSQAKYPLFSADIGGDRWIFVDFERVDLERLAEEVESSDTARYVFLVTHGPFTAPDSPSWRWRLNERKSKGGNGRDVKRLYEALSRRRAIVLSGHTHTTMYARYENECGGFSEFTANAVWMAPELATAEPIHDSPEQYGTYRRSLVPADRLADYDAEHALFRSALKEYFFSFAAGHARLDISDSAVDVVFYPGDSREPGRVFRMYNGGERGVVK